MIGVGVSTMLPKAASSPGVSYDVDAEALFFALESDETPFDTTKKGHVNTLIVAIKAANAWADIDALYLYNTADTSWQRSIKQSTGWTTTSSVGCSTTELDGLTTDGVIGSGHQTNYNPHTAGGVFVQDDAMQAIWCKTNPNITGPMIGGSTFWGNIKDASSRTGFRGNDGTTSNSATNSRTDATGLTWLQREDASNKRSYVNANASALGNHAVASTARANALMHVMCNALSQTPATNRVLMAMFGRSMDATKRAAVHAALLAYFQARGTLA